MGRLIYAEKLIEDFEPEHYVDWYTPWIIDKINEQPTVDAVEVVRCKDCQFRDDPYDMGGLRYCLRIKHYTWDDNYCSFGAKRGGGEKE